MFTYDVVLFMRCCIACSMKGRSRKSRSIGLVVLRRKRLQTTQGLKILLTGIHVTEPSTENSVAIVTVAADHVLETWLFSVINVRHDKTKIVIQYKL